MMWNGGVWCGRGWWKWWWGKWSNQPSIMPSHYW
jgi:hypothetical protein